MEYRGAIVTGAGRGIGRAVALALACEGVATYLCARGQAGLEETARQCRSLGAESIAHAADLTKVAELPALAADAEARLGGVDILVNCAGLCPNDGIENVTEEEWDAVMNINLKGTFFLTQQVFAHMKERRRGYIVNINSTVTLGAKPSVTVYSASKYGLAGITTALYEEAKQYGIRVSSVYPGVTDTEMLRGQARFCPPELWMKPEDIAYCVMFLLRSPPRMVVKDVVPWACGYDKI